MVEIGGWLVSGQNERAHNAGAMRKRVLVVLTLAVLIGAGVYFAIGLERGPAVKLALKASELGPDWEGNGLVTQHEGRSITQDFFRIVPLDEDTKLQMQVYQRTSVWPNTDAALKDEELGSVRQRAEALESTFWDECYEAGLAGGTWGLALRKSNIVVILQYVEHYVRRSPWTGEFPRRGWDETGLSAEEILRERGVEDLLYGLATVVQEKIVRLPGLVEP